METNFNFIKPSSVTKYLLNFFTYLIMLKPFLAHEPHKTVGGLDVTTGPSAVSVQATGTSLLSHYSHLRPPLPLPKTIPISIS